MFKISVLLNRRLSSYKLLYICPKNKERTNQFKTYSLHIDLLQPIRRPVFALWRRLWRSTGQARRPKPVSSEHQWTTSCSKVHKAIFCFQMWDDWVFKWTFQHHLKKICCSNSWSFFSLWIKWNYNQNINMLQKIIKIFSKSFLTVSGMYYF